MTGVQTCALPICPDRKPQDIGDFARICGSARAEQAIVAHTCFERGPDLLVRFAGNEADCAAGSIAPYQRALRKAQHLGPFDIGNIVRRGGRARQIDAIEINADRRIEAKAFVSRDYMPRIVATAAVALVVPCGTVTLGAS